jgi:branched-chain amino acid transport system substrate-binding protein
MPPRPGWIAGLLAAAAALVIFVPAVSMAEGAKLVTLGASLQLTGPDANLARYFRDGYQIAVERINEAGGLTIRGETYRLALKILDNQSDTNLAVQHYVELVTRDHVDFLLGPYNSNQTLDTSSVAEKYGVPMVSGGGAAKQIFARGYRYIFGTSPPAENYFGSTIAMMSKLEPRVRSIALLTADDAFDVSVRQGTVALANQNGFGIAFDQVYSEHKPNFGSLLAQIKAKMPDAILMGGHESETLDFMREAKSLDVHPHDMVALTVGVPGADFRAALGKDAEGVFGMTPWVASPVQRDRWFGDAQQFAHLFHQRFGYEPDYHVASAVADVETFATALETADTLDRAELRDAIARCDFDSVFATIRFQENGQIDLPQLVIQVQDGKIVPIYTDHFLNKPRYPVPGWNKRS